MSARDDHAAIVTPSLARLTIGPEEEQHEVRVRAMDLVQIARFTRAVRPIFDDVAALFSGGIEPAAIMALIETKLPHVAEALAEASLPHRKGEADDQRDARVAEQVELLRCTPTRVVSELLLEVIAANRDFLSGRLMSALRTAGTMARAGDGTTPASQSQARPAGPATTSAP